MEKDIRETIALKRFEIISPVLSDVVVRRIRISQVVTGYSQIWGRFGQR